MITVQRITPKKQQASAEHQTEPFAPGWPGIPARWTSSAKSGVGTALDEKSCVWFTLSHGIFNEIYYPRLDNACVRDMGLVVTNGIDFFSEEKRDTGSTIHCLAEGVPGFRLVNTCREGRYCIEKEVVTDPGRNTVLQKLRFIPLQGELSSYELYVLLAPHLGNQGSGNTAWVGEFEGQPLLFARHGKNTLALACSSPWLKRSVGYVGSSDGWQDLASHKTMAWEYSRAENGNIALTGGIDLMDAEGDCTLAVGFGKDADEAAHNAIGSLRDGFDKAKNDYITGWKKWIKTLTLKENDKAATGDLSAISLAVLRTHESKQTPGAFIASLSIPWGFSKGDKDLGGYHLVWSRDMVETAGGLLAAGAYEDVLRALAYLQATQQPDGHWAQNMWLDGTPYWNGIQMDETALPILLTELAFREKALNKAAIVQFWPMVKNAAGYLVRNGPVSPQDRWEEDPGYTPFTVAAQIAALLAAADLADMNNEKAVGAYLREIADVWNGSIERWMYISDSDWSRKYGVKGYYIRISTEGQTAGTGHFRDKIDVRNVPAAKETMPARHLISVDFLALVRFGLRLADDPRIIDTLKVSDGMLKIETPSGPTWHRYNDDGYGEHRDGSPFDGTGVGRGWPLLTGERAHYELMAGRLEDAKKLRNTMESFANDGGLISEQVWDQPDIPSRELHFGHPSGSAMPLVWAHAEYLKLQRSLRDGRVFDLPPQTVQRYLVEKNICPRIVWRFNHKIRTMPSGKILRVETLAPAMVHWSENNWLTVRDTATKDSDLGIHYADLPTTALQEGDQVLFTFYWPRAEHWENRDYRVKVLPYGDLTYSTSKQH
ncbi:MAG TPA: glucan 1,4-alpha-glucosidase [Puia sp.]|nr:glucan 1,4-alpha-glucosidase [Puia sp.]